jgi:hypothetical protein
MKRTILGLIFVMGFTLCYSQENKLKNAVFVEVLGNGLWYSLNYEHRILNKGLARIGLGLTSESLTVPITFGGLIGESKNFFELGVGATVNMHELGEGGVRAIFITGTIGYRYEKPNGKFFFRTGFTPLVTVYEPTAEDFVPFIPLIGISCGFRL